MDKNPYFSKINRMFSRISISKKYVAALHLTVILAALYFTSLYSYLLFHSLAEIINIVVALAIFLIVWNSWRYIDNAYFLIIGVALFFSGLIYAFHLLAYKGMNILTNDANLATQLWVSARYLVSISFFSAPLFINKKIRIGKIFTIYLVLFTLLFLSIFYFKNFPTAFGADGLTPFKKISEFVICGFFIGAIILLRRKKERFDRRVLQMIYASLGLMVATELFFTQYASVYGFMNLLGHMLMIASAYFLYLGIVEISLMKPYRLLFKNIKDSETAIRASEERYLTLVEMSPEAIFVHRGGNFLYLNSASLKLFGARTKSDLENKNILDLVIAEDRKKMAGITNSLLGADINSSFAEIGLINLKGENIDVEIREKMIFYEDQAAVQALMINISERKNIEKALLNERNRLINILDTMPDGVYITSSSFEVEYVNPAFRKIFGEDFAGKKCYDYFHGGASKCSWCEADKVLKGETLRFESNLLKRAGKEYDLVETPLYNPDGSSSVLTICRDMSVAHQAQKLIKESERRYRMIFENTGTATILFDDNGKAVLANSQFAGLSGYEKEEIEGKMEWDKLIYEKDLERVGEYRRIRLLDPGKAPKFYEYHFKTKAGGLRNVFATVERVPEIKKTIVSLIDITENKKMREVLKASEKRYKAIGELIPFGMWECDAQGRSTYLSQNYLDKIGMTLEEYKKIGWKMMVHPDDWENVSRDWKECVEKGNEWSHEHRIKDKNGAYYTILSKGAPIRNELGRILSWSGIDLDITQRRKAEDALKTSHDALEDEVRQRTEELVSANEKLTKEAEERARAERILGLKTGILEFLSSSSDRKEYLEFIVEFLKKASRCRYLGIRLTDGGKRIPYEAYLGFSREFWEKENSISIGKDACVCTRVIGGESFEADLPYKTAKGSFYCGNTAAFAASLGEEAKKFFRGACIQSGFLTIAVIPIYDNDKIIGAIHIADKKENRINSEELEAIESLTPLIGEGISKFNLTDKISRLNQELEGRVLERTEKLALMNESMTKEIVERKKIEEEREALLKQLEQKSNNIENLAHSLKKERDMLKIIMENTGTQLAYLDRYFNFINVNSAFALSSGYSKDKLMGKNYFQIFPHEENQSIFEKVRDSGTPAEFKARPFVFPQQPWRGVTYCDWTLIPIRGVNGQMESLVFSQMDVTDQKRNEENLKIHTTKLEHLTDELGKFQLAVENASDFIFITNPEGLILFANKAAKEMTGFLPSEIIGQTPSIWEDGAAEESYADIWSKAGEEKTPFRGEVVSQRKNKEQFIGELNLSPITDSFGSVIFFVGIMRDITKAKEIDRAKNEFISMASHQLRTPLTTINLSVELLMRGISSIINEKQHGYLKEIYSSARRMTDLISVLLNVSRIELGTFVVKEEVYDLVALADRIVEELDEHLKSKNLKLERQYGVPRLDINFDMNIFRIAFENLLTNAVRYTPTGGEVKIGLAVKGGKAVVSVKDSGCGIPKDDLDKIFLKSYRSENAKKISSDGTGLGLYIARSVARQAGAEITCESLESKGSTFYLSIPLNVEVALKQESLISV